METLLDGGAFFESPRWHDGRWWVSDFFRRVVLTVDERGRAHEVIRIEGQPSGLGWLPDGSLLVVSMRDRRLIRRSPNRGVRVHADLFRLCDWHANDLVVAADGSAYVGNFGFDAEGCVWFADARRNRCVRVAEGGKVTGMVSVPESLRCFACMLGGDDGRTRAICAAPDYDERARTPARESVVFVTRVDVPHAGRP
jgi:sugar lactone lactonase YvrE